MTPDPRDLIHADSAALQARFRRSILWQLDVLAGAAPKGSSGTTDSSDLSCGGEAVAALPQVASPVVSHLLLDPSGWDCLTGASPDGCPLDLLALKKQWGKKVVIVITAPEEFSEPAWSQADGFYIPGAHSRQGDLLQAAGHAGKPLWIERGSFLAPSDFENVLKRVGADRPSESAHPEMDPPVTLVDTGSQYGYADRVLDTRALCLYEEWDVAFSLSYTDLATGGEPAGENWRPRWADAPGRDRFVFQCAQQWGAGLVFKSPVSKPDQGRLVDADLEKGFLAKRADHLAAAVRHVLAQAPFFSSEVRLSHD